MTQQQSDTLPALVDRAANCLASARTSAEILEARDRASIAYDMAKGAARIATAKQAHDDVLKKVYRAQADALLIEAQAKIRLADEYDAAQERGEVGKSGARSDLVPVGNEVTPSAADTGLTRKAIHDARRLRDAEAADPGIAERTVEAALERGDEPTKAELRRSVLAAIDDAKKRPRRAKNPLYRPDPEAMAVGDFTCACEEVANTKDIAAIANWRDRPFMVDQALEKALAAQTVIEKFLQIRGDADA